MFEMVQVVQGRIANFSFMRPMLRGFVRALTKLWLPVSGYWSFSITGNHAGQSLANG